MAQNHDLVLYTAQYDNVSAALTDLDAVEQLHKDELIGSYDAAVIDEENGKPKIVKRMDHPRIRAVPEAFGSGKLPRNELLDAAGELTANEAGLIVVGHLRERGQAHRARPDLGRTRRCGERHLDGQRRHGRHRRAGSCQLITLAYRIASYWLPLLAGPPAHLLFRHRYGTPAVRPADQQGTDADPEHRPRGGNDS